MLILRYINPRHGGITWSGAFLYIDPGLYDLLLQFYFIFHISVHPISVHMYLIQGVFIIEFVVDI